MLSAEDARLLKTRPVNQITQAIDAIETAIRRAAAQGRVTEVDITALVPQPYSQMWQQGSKDAVIDGITDVLTGAGYAIKVRETSPSLPGLIMVSWKD